MDDSAGKDPLQILPGEMNRHIFSWLPVKCLFRCMSVSKEWQAFVHEIKNAHAGKLQLLIISSRQDNGGEERFIATSMNPDLSFQWVSSPLFTLDGHDYFRFFEGFRPKILDSCNELVLVSAGKKVLLWNPLTRWFRVVFGLYNHEEYTLRDGSVVLGSICYDTSIKDYKIVLQLRCLTADRRGYTNRCVSFASLKSNVWKDLGPPSRGGVPRSGAHSARKGVNFHNTFHWSVCHNVQPPVRNIPGGPNNKIVYFDPVNDEFKILPSPEPCHREEDDWIVGMGVVNDCLCMARLDDKTKMVQVLAMKEYGNGESWFRAFDVSLSRFGCQGDDLYNFTFFSLEKNGKVLMNYNDSRILVYDPASEDVLRVRVLLPDSEINHGMCFYAQSFASPYDQLKLEIK
ncbi:unnamed protein product [Cuscuta europaea]|uniref:F-box domain-containing protein n=1 Tax=Cuscuta europaea TaxID=41803 RepID=A0A9P0ZBH6_CUSEU|nr:unnamed protein product [Cuscuta europaea]